MTQQYGPRNYSDYPERMVIYDEQTPFIRCDGCFTHYTTDAKRINYDKSGLKFINYVPVTHYIRSDGFKRNYCVDTGPCLAKQTELKKAEEARQRVQHL